jgi:23S rRNA pseudouridine2605 synthase
MGVMRVEMMAERVQKIMAAAGYGSRRQCEEFIKEGRVKVNGTLVQLGQKADASSDVILLDGEPISGPEPLAYYLLHKPVGVLSSLQSQGGHPTVGDLVSVPERIYPVGRLDLDSEGLLLLTNDGDLAHKLTHPRYEHEKEYLVWLNRSPSEEMLDRWRKGLPLPGLGKSAPARVELLNPGQHKLRVVMHEGMNRQIRVTAETLGYKVVRLIRIRMGGLSLGGLQAGKWRSLTQPEIARVRRQAELQVDREVG